MKKIPTLFVRDLETHRVVDALNSACAWVAAGEGRATRKFDGQACLVVGGVLGNQRLYRRREVKTGKPIPDGFNQVDEDAVTGKRFGWVLIGDGSEDKWFRKAFENGFGDWLGNPFVDGQTYELVGPKVQGNPEHFDKHVLVDHGGPGTVMVPVPTDFAGLQGWFTGKDIEGIVWHHPDGRMAKIKGKDFGIERID